MRISHNLLAMNTQRMLGINDKKKIGAAEKLSSGYKINRAADDAAGLAISEKMRRLIRGLNQGTDNAQDGVSWVQVGDGALNEAHEILHRMTELTVKALNETNSDSDRMAMELEFEQLQSELDNIGNNTKFNELPIFEQHQIPYYQCEGAVKWDPQQNHVVTSGQNKLIIEYSMSETEKPQTLEITVPPGEYTTQELVDEIDTLIGESGQDDIVFEFTKNGYCNANLEGGEKIHAVSGGLSYLVYDMYKGGSFGALIGTTSFPTETSRLKVVSGQNDAMTFTIEDFNGGSQEKSIQIPAGSYTRSELIDLMNNQLGNTTVKATAYGDGIKLASDEAIVTGFKGNMFKIDGTKPVYNSVFYDNVKYGSVVQEAAVFTGGNVLPTDSRDEEHRYYNIDSRVGNHTLVVQANNMSAPVTLTIADGKYTAATMATELNRLFADAGIDLSASRVTISSGKFEGIKITSNMEGPDSKILIDSANSGAYDTLFTAREYNQYGNTVYPSNETKADNEGVFKGSKDLAILSTNPLIVTAGVNDSFKLSINGNEYTITMSEQTYNSVDDIVDELNNQLNGASALTGYKGMITASKENNKIILTGNAGQGVNTIRVSEGTKDVFDSIFQGYTAKTTYPAASGTGSVTLNTPYDGNISSSESSMTIKVDNQNYTVNLPTGDVSQTDIKNAIEQAIPGRTEVTKNEFTTVTDTGESNSRHFSKAASGTTNVSYWSNTAKGSSEQQEGVVGFIKNEPAVLEIGPTLQSSMKVTSANNGMTLTINGVVKTLILDEGTYTPNSLASALQKKIDEAFGNTGMNGAAVSVNNHKLVLTARLPEGYDGAETSISASTSSSTFLKELNTTRTAAEWTSTNNLASSITIDSSNQTLAFTYSQGGSTKNITLTLSKGSYTRDSIVSEINTQLAKTGTGITASVPSGKLVLKSSAVGSDVSIRYDTTTGGSSAEALFGPLTQPSAADIVVNLKTQDSIKIELAKSDTFTIKVNGANQTVTLDPGTYDRDSFIAMLNSKLSVANTGVQAYKFGDKLGFTTDAVGTSASVSMSYAGGGNSMEAIYGVTTKEYSGVKVSFEADGRMNLSTTKSGSSISVSSGSGGAFQQPTITYTKVATDYTDGYHSTKKSYIDGVNLSGDVTIDQWNNDLNFTFKNNGVNQSVAIQIPEVTYTQADLQTKLQELIDNQVGAGAIAVTVSTSGVRLEAVNTGSLYQFSNFSGDFYDKVICSCVEESSVESVNNEAGTQTVDGVYTVGRKDVRSGGVEIKRGISDELSLDLTYGNTVHTISVTLDAGKYTGDELKTHLQEKINEQLKNMGLQENLIQVGIGGINTGVHGANDNNALNFSLSKTVQAPAEGQFIIDGVSGNAAFEIFYQTDGKMEPAYIMGTKDVSEGVTIVPGEEDLTIEVDGVTYSVTISAGDYTAAEILDVINDQFDAAGAPIIAELDEDRLKISHRKLGEHDIQSVSGGARDEVFFQENGETDPLASRYVKLSSEENDRIGLNRHIFTTANLGINSSCISKTKYAEKALERIQQAVEKISAIRSDFGSTQNRLEHAINNNENKAENLQSAESVIRDADMAEEMLALSKYNILLQAGQAMLAQANQSQQGVMTLLR